MKSHVVSAANAYLLIAMSLWAFVDTGSKGVFVPVLFGVLILILNNGVQYNDKVSTRVVTVLTIAVLAVLYVDLMKYITKGNITHAVRIGTMMLFSGFSSLVLVRSLLKKRKKKTLRS